MTPGSSGDGQSGFWRLYDQATIGLLAFSGALMFGLAILNAGLRYLFSAPLIWGEEISRYAMVWGTLIGIAVAYRTGQHISIDLLLGTLTRRVILILRQFSHLMALVTALLLCWSGQVLTGMMMHIAAPSSGISMAWVLTAFPAGGILLAVEALRLVARDLRQLRAGAA